MAISLRKNEKEIKEREEQSIKHLEFNLANFDNWKYDKNWWDD